jgi:tRNA (cmo5U34)-methyltransferase
MTKKPVDNMISAVPGAWRFDAEVSRAFDAHVRKSVPFYEELQRMVVELSDYFVRDQSTIYDLGSSTGVTLDLLAARHEAKENAQFVGVDLSESMVREAQARVKKPNVRFIHKNVMDVEFAPPANFVISLYTLQFLTLTERRQLLRRVYGGMVEGGALLLAEKTRAENSFFEDVWLELYWDFKRRQGLTPEQILEKANSLRGVLNPLTTEENLDLLLQTGFSRVEVFFKWYNWSGFMAVKNECLRQAQGPGMISSSALPYRPTGQATDTVLNPQTPDAPDR